MSLFVNNTPLAAAPVPLIDRDGRNVVVVIAKATYEVLPDGVLKPADPLPIEVEDQMVGPDPANAMLRVPSDVYDSKPAVDVLVIAPEGPLAESPLYGRNIAIEVGPVKSSGAVTSNWTFGPLRRDSSQRKKHAGTYDAAWSSDRMPLLPKDFDPRYHQLAPPGQTAPGMVGDEPFRLINIYEKGQTISGVLPGRTVIIAACASGRYLTQQARLDTVCFHTSAPLMTLTWRLPIPTKRAPSEVTMVFVYYPRLHAARQLYGVP